jgi:tetratricopeptide (TPR) repeat protein
MVKAVRDLLDRGLVQYSLGERNQAIDLWRKALEVAPRDERATDYLGSVGASLVAPRAGDLYEAVTDDVAPPVVLGSSRRPPFTDEMPIHQPASERPAEPTVDGDGDGDSDGDSVITDVEILLRGAAEAERGGELEQALGKTEEVLRREPEHFEASELALDLRRRLSDRYRSALEPLDAVPYLKATDASILELSLDPIGGFLISQIDGEITVEELLTILGTFDEFRVLSSLHFFLENGIIELRVDS